MFGEKETTNAAIRGRVFQKKKLFLFFCPPWTWLTAAALVCLGLNHFVGIGEEVGGGFWMTWVIFLLLDGHGFLSFCFWRMGGYVSSVFGADADTPFCVLFCFPMSFILELIG